MKCPYCYRPLNPNKWTHDPLLIPNGSKYKWSDKEETILIEESDVIKRLYKGFSQIREDDIIELQDEFKALEIEYLPEDERTEFSPVNVNGIFQITGKHIKEMRDSVGKLLDVLGLLYEDYFNYDEDGNYIARPGGVKEYWTDPITSATDLQNFQIKNIHIEDLRHYIQTIWIETWDGLVPPNHIDKTYNGFVYTVPVYFSADHDWSYRIYISGPSGYPPIINNTYFHVDLLSETSGGEEILDKKIRGNGNITLQSSGVGIYPEARITHYITFINSNYLSVQYSARNLYLDCDGSFNHSLPLVGRRMASIGFKVMVFGDLGVHDKLTLSCHVGMYYPLTLPLHINLYALWCANRYYVSPEVWNTYKISFHSFGFSGTATSWDETQITTLNYDYIIDTLKLKRYS